MEKLFILPTPDDKRIYGVVHIPEKPTTFAAIIVHGLTGRMHEFVHLTVARYLTQKGIAVVRFNQYDDREGARRFQDSTIRLHVADTRQIMAHARSLGFTDLVLVGHSLGGPISITAADDETRALVLWDPCAAPSERIRDWSTYEPERGISFLDWQIRVLLGQEWIEDAKTFPDPFQTISKLTLPVKIIAAGDGNQFPACDRYRAVLAGRHEYVIVPDSGHVFAEEGAVERVSVETETWIASLV